MGRAGALGALQPRVVRGVDRLGTVEMGETMNEPFIVGETVKIIDGPFNDFFGNIEEVYEEKKKLKVKKRWQKIL